MLEPSTPEGTIIVFDSKNYSKYNGALARVIKDNGSQINLQWINKHEFRHGLSDGEYSREYFKIFEKKGDGETTCMYCGNELMPVLYGKETFKVCHNCELRE